MLGSRGVRVMCGIDFVMAVSHKEAAKADR